MKKEKNGWKKLKGWQKGALFGWGIGLIFITIALITENIGYKNLPEFLLFMLIFYLLFPVLCGTLIGFLSSLIKIKKNPVFLGGILGLVIGVFSVFLFEVKGINEIFLFPLVIISKFILLIKSPVWEGAGPLFILIHIVLWSLIGMIIGFIIAFIYVFYKKHYKKLKGK